MGQAEHPVSGTEMEVNQYVIRPVRAHVFLLAILKYYNPQ